MVTCFRLAPHGTLSIPAASEQRESYDSQLPLSLDRRHNNQQLFSDHYLNITLPGRPKWKLVAHDAGQALAQIAPIVRASVPSDNEAQTEEDLIRPILRVLGHTFEVQPALKTPDGTKKPDYVFYRDLAALNANKNRILDEVLLQGKTFAVGDAKEWGARSTRTSSVPTSIRSPTRTRPIRSPSTSSTAVWSGAS
jgi:hypothetical protein